MLHDVLLFLFFRLKCARLETFQLWASGNPKHVAPNLIEFLGEFAQHEEPEVGIESLEFAELSLGPVPVTVQSANGLVYNQAAVVNICCHTIFVLVSIVMIPITVIIPIIAIITLFSCSMWVLVTSFQELAISQKTLLHVQALRR